MTICSLRYSRFALVVWLCVVMLIGHTTVVVSEQVEGEAPESDCTMENGKCVNPDIEPSVPVTTKEDPNCPSREHVIRCAGLHLDTNKNGLLERAELQSAIDRLPWYGRGIIKILGSIDKMMSKCDMDGDDAISMEYDMSKNGHQCLATCFKRRSFKGAFFPDCE